MASSSSDGFGGDYSFLLQSIEAKISENMKGGDVSELFSSPMAEYSSALKRRRESGAPTPSMDYNFGSAKKLRSMMEMDEVVLENEQLKDQLQRLKAESQIAREEQIRQIKFLDERCTSFKKESAERLEKYYEEKKKWQSKQRETELLLKKAMEKAATPAPSVPSSAASNANNELVTQKLRILEKDLMTKVSEAKSTMQEKLTLESQLYEANLELKELRAAQGAGSMNGEAMSEARTLRKQFSELETVYKRMAREHEVMKLKMKNQSLLEEEVSTFRAKLRIAEETVSALKHIQAEHQQLQDEKVLWSQLFQEIVQEAREADHPALFSGEDGSLLDVLSTTSSSGATSAPAVSPAQVLRVLSAYQRQCAVLLQGQGQLQQAQAEVRRQLREAIKTQRAAEDESVRLSDELEKMEGQLRSASQHSRLYTSEISTLRAMLATYDSEFSIGKPDTAKVFALKDQLIAELRTQLDAARSEISMSSTKARLLEARVEELEGAVAAGKDESRRLQDAVASAASEVSRAKEELAEQMQAVGSSVSQEDAAQLEALKTQATEAQEQLAYFQYVTGLDYLPDRTRVLHLPMNPSSHVPLTNTVPSVAALKKLRVESVQQMRALQQQLQQSVHNSNSSCEGGGEDARSTSTGSAQGDDADQSLLGGRPGHHLNMSVLEAPHLGSASSSSSGSHAACPASCASAVALRNSEKLNQRLKEMFRERISSFREGVYLLTGYKVELIGADSSDSLPLLRLRSMFAERPEDTLMFQLKGDAPELMETEFASRLEPHLLHHLKVTNSVPAFLASVTLDLFENQTFMG